MAIKFEEVKRLRQALCVGKGSFFPSEHSGGMEL